MSMIIWYGWKGASRHANKGPHRPPPKPQPNGKAPELAESGIPDDMSKTATTLFTPRSTKNADAQKDFMRQMLYVCM